MPINLNNRSEILALDSKNMLGSLEQLSEQIEEIATIAKKVKIPAAYKRAKNITVFGMGGSTLGSHIIKSLYPAALPVPFDIVNHYAVPKYIGKDSLVIISSYSGTTEEALAALEAARKKKAKLLIMTSGGGLAVAAKKYKIPALIFTTENNPCGSPRMGLGYTIFGQLMLLNQCGLIRFGAKEMKLVRTAIEKYGRAFGVANEKSLAKKIAGEVGERSVWYFGSSHLAGNVHAGSNQMNENAKRFAGYFIIPELNHHLLEGMMQPASNKNGLLMILVESHLYDARVSKRFAVTKEILDKNGIMSISYVCQEKTMLEQVAEVLVFTSYVSYFTALLTGIDPTAIPFVDYFKAALKK